MTEDLSHEGVSAEDNPMTFKKCVSRLLKGHVALDCHVNKNLFGELWRECEARTQHTSHHQ